PLLSTAAQRIYRQRVYAPRAGEARNALRFAHQAGLAIEQVQVCFGVEQPLRLVLSVDARDARGEIAQDADRNQRAVDRGAALPLDLDLAAQDGLAVVHGQA